MNPNNPEDRPNHTPEEWRALREHVSKLEAEIKAYKEAVTDKLHCSMLEVLRQPCPHMKELEELKKDRAEIISGYFRLSNECSELRASEEDLKFVLDDAQKALQDFADAECVYGDNCPTFGTRHGQCSGCKARKALEKMGG